MLGHAKASMTLDLYADLFDDDLEAVAERLDRPARGVGGMTAAGTVVDLPARQRVADVSYSSGDEGVFRQDIRDRSLTTSATHVSRHRRHR